MTKPLPPHKLTRRALFKRQDRAAKSVSNSEKNNPKPAPKTDTVEPGWKATYAKGVAKGTAAKMDKAATPVRDIVGQPMVVQVQYERTEAPKPATGYMPRPGARPTIYVPREMTEAEHVKHLADQLVKTALPAKPPAQYAATGAIQGIGKADLPPAPTKPTEPPPAHTWSQSQVVCAKPLRKVIIEKMHGADEGSLHICFINTHEAKQVHTHIKIWKDTAQALHDLLELAGCTQLKHPIAVEMTFDIPKELTKRPDA